MSKLAFANAKREVAYFSKEVDNLIAEHNNAMEACDCDLWLEIGINAFEWITRAEGTLRKAIYNGHEIETLNEETLSEALDVLYSSWMEPCAKTQKWMQVHEERGYKLENSSKFLECYESALEIIEQREWAANARKNRDACWSSDDEYISPEPPQ